MRLPPPCAWLILPAILPLIMARPGARTHLPKDERILPAQRLSNAMLLSNDFPKVLLYVRSCTPAKRELMFVLVRL